MKIVVLGAAGVQGKAALVYLSEQADATDIIASDLRETELSAFVASLGDKRVHAQRLDLRDFNASKEAFENCDVVLNCALTLGGYAMTTRAALDAGVNYMDLTTKGERDAQQGLDSEFRRKNLVCLQDMGIAPGLTNVIAAYLIDKLDQTHTIDYKMITVDLIPDQEHSRPINCPIPLSDIMYLYSKPTYVFEAGKLLELEPRAMQERFVFQEPIGAQNIVGIAHSEPICLSRSFGNKGIQRISSKTSYGKELDDKVVFLRDLGFGNRNPINVKGQMVVPFDVLETLVNNLPAESKKQPDFVADLVAVIAGEKDGKNVEYRVRAAISPSMHMKMKQRGCTGSYRAGVCAAAAATMIARGQISAKGVVEPELAIPPEPYFKELARFGFEIEMTVKKPL